MRIDIFELLIQINNLHVKIDGSINIYNYNRKDYTTAADLLRQIYTILNYESEITFTETPPLSIDESNSSN